mgnify:CR=1 FL=1|jgi:UPF0042 nucleotide-binding protein
MKLIILSGRSGSGKSVALQALEDLGFYCVDNLPAKLLPALAHHFEASALHKKVALCIDARNEADDIESFAESVEDLSTSLNSIEIVYLDAQNDVLLQRYSSTRRKHPLSTVTVSLVEAIDKESALLAPIHQLATLQIDTTQLSVQSLRQLIQERVANVTHQDMTLLIQSFGFKFGLPRDADFVFDVRCLPNPFWDPSLRGYTGVDKPVQDFLSAEPDVIEMYDDIREFIERWIDRFAASNRSYITVAIGCTGGQHRSVYLVELLTKAFYSRFNNIQKRHRELENEM